MQGASQAASSLIAILLLFFFYSSFTSFSGFEFLSRWRVILDLFLNGGFYATAQLRSRQ